MLKASKAKNKLPKPEKDEAPKPEKENPNPEKKEDTKKKEDELSFVERVKLGRQYVNKINALKARKAYMEQSLEIITKRDDLSIRISSGGSIDYYTFRKDGGIEYKYGAKSYPNFVTSMYYFTKNRSDDSLGVFPLSKIISNEDNIKLIKDEYISLYRDSISDIDELIKELEIKFAEL